MEIATLRLFHRIATNTERYPNFLKSICMPQMDGTVQAARQLQAVQSVMYLKATTMNMEGYAHCRADEVNYKGSMLIMQALKDRHGDDIEFMAPDNVPTGPATDIFAPVEGGEARKGVLRHLTHTHAFAVTPMFVEWVVRRVPFIGTRLMTECFVSWSFVSWPIYALCPRKRSRC